ncbi:MAG TPA: hypothetical protein VIS72_02340, partial [Anaerolineales bacterium]
DTSFPPSIESKQLPMPAQQCVWLNYVKGLFPELREMRKKYEAKTVRIGELRLLDLPIQHDQLLA